MRQGFLHVVAIMDWHSRKVPGWRQSNRMETRSCVEALKEPLAIYGSTGTCDPDQGARFTGSDFTGVSRDAKVQISIEGCGGWIDDRMIGRLWRSLKSERVHLNAFETGSDARAGIGMWINYHDERRTHSSRGLPTSLILGADISMPPPDMKPIL